jgi:hypothetical protein
LFNAKTRPARNLKFYPLALSQAINTGKLKFIAEKFKVQTCRGDEKLLRDMDVWELLNLRPEAILDIPERLHEEHGVSSEFLQDTLKEFNIQTVGRGPLEEFHHYDKDMQYFLAKTRHYSWPKGTGMFV